MSSIAGDLFSSDDTERQETFSKAVQLLNYNGSWERDIGYGCNLCHFAAFIPADTMDKISFDLKARLQEGDRE